MQLKYGAKLLLSLVVFCLLVSTGFCDSSYDRELIVQDKTRAMQVESVFKQMMAAYEDEDARGFLDHVSDERFRQDYITFTDALYNDFRNYEIHQVDYWIDKVVADNVKQFLFVHWEKRYENLDDGQQLTQKGVSRFLFDEVEGDYLLVELAGNNLFGASLPEWTQEVPQISGQELTARVTEPGAVCDAQHLTLCDATNCAINGGYWYDNSCNQTPYNPAAVCDSTHLNLCDSTNCSSNGGYWYDNTCNQTAYVPPVVCDNQHLDLCDGSNCSSNGGYWYNNTCNGTPQALPDLVIFDLNVNVSMVGVSIRNDGTATSSSCTVHWTNGTPPYDATATVPALSAGESQNVTIDGLTDMQSDGGTVTVDYYNVVPESNESNNVATYQ